MAKTIDEIKELLASDLFRKGTTKNYIVVSDDLKYQSQINLNYLLSLCPLWDE